MQGVCPACVRARTNRISCFPPDRLKTHGRKRPGSPCAWQLTLQPPQATCAVSLSPHLPRSPRRHPSLIRPNAHVSRLRPPLFPWLVSILHCVASFPTRPLPLPPLFPSITPLSCMVLARTPTYFRPSPAFVYLTPHCVGALSFPFGQPSHALFTPRSPPFSSSPAPCWRAGGVRLQQGHRARSTV
jgi:hypothetical protein